MSWMYPMSSSLSSIAAESRSSSDICMMDVSGKSLSRSSGLIFSSMLLAMESVTLVFLATGWLSSVSASLKATRSPLTVFSASMPNQPLFSGMIPLDISLDNRSMTSSDFWESTTAESP